MKNFFGTLWGLVIPLGLLAGAVHPVEFGAQLQQGLLVGLAVGQLDQRQRDDGLVVRVVRRLGLLVLVTGGRRRLGRSRLPGLGSRRRLRLLLILQHREGRLAPTAQTAG